MTHPTQEEWMGYLYGELDKKSRARLAAHLRACSECQGHVATWQGAMAELDSWQVPDRYSHVPRLRRGVQWAVAAMLLLGVGYGIARLSVPAPDIETLRRSLQTSLRPSLEASIRQELRKDLNAEWGDALRATRAQLHEDAVQLAAAASSAMTRRFLTDFVKSFEAMRTEERQAMVTLLGELESRRFADYQQLRNGLETLAGLTEDEFLRTKQDVVRLLAYNLPAGGVSEVSDDSKPNIERRQR